MYDFKAAIMYIGALALGNINEILTTTGLLLNVGYIAYQLYTHHKKNNDKAE